MLQSFEEDLLTHPFKIFKIETLLSIFEVLSGRLIIDSIIYELQFMKTSLYAGQSFYEKTISVANPSMYLISSGSHWFTIKSVMFVTNGHS